MQHLLYYLVPIAGQERHKKFNHNLKEVEQLKHFCEY